MSSLLSFYCVCVGGGGEGVKWQCEGHGSFFSSKCLKSVSKFHSKWHFIECHSINVRRYLSVAYIYIIMYKRGGRNYNLYQRPYITDLPT